MHWPYNAGALSSHVRKRPEVVGSAEDEEEDIVGEEGDVVVVPPEVTDRVVETEEVEDTEDDVVEVVVGSFVMLVSEGSIKICPETDWKTYVPSSRATRESRPFMLSIIRCLYPPDKTETMGSERMKMKDRSDASI